MERSVVLRTPSRPTILVEGAVGAALLASLLLVSGRISPFVVILQGAPGVFLLGASFWAASGPVDREPALWGWTSVGVAAWTFVACFTLALAHLWPLLWADLALGVLAAAVGSWVALGS